MYEVLCEYKKKVEEAEQKGIEKPIIPDYLGECFILISQRLSMKINFINYSWRDEMIADAIENAVMVVDNFDCDKYTNPFAYFTTVIYWAFVRRIDKENKQSYIKYKAFQHFNTQGLLTNTLNEVDENAYSIQIDDKYMNNVIETFEKRKDKKAVKNKEKKKGVEVFYDEEKK